MHEGKDQGCLRVTAAYFEEQVAQKIPPQYRQWCFLRKKLNELLHFMHFVTSLSMIQRGLTRTTPPLGPGVEEPWVPGVAAA